MDKPVPIIPVSFFDLPLYRPFVLPEIVGPYRTEIAATLRMYCKQCGTEQTYQPKLVEHVEKQFVMWRSAAHQTGERLIDLPFLCAGCQQSAVHYYLHLMADGKTIAKVGQHPSQSIQPPKDVERFLGSNLDVYKKGRISEIHGFGIGAFA
jgi:hypothetical protein